MPEKKGDLDNMFVHTRQDFNFKILISTYLDRTVNLIYFNEHQLNVTHSYDTEQPIASDTILSKNFDKRDDSDIGLFLYLIWLNPSVFIICVCISQLIYIVFVSSPVFDFSNRNRKVKAKSREIRNHKPQPIPDTKRKRKRTAINAYEVNTQMREEHIDQLSRPQAKVITKHENKEQSKTNL